MNMKEAFVLTASKTVLTSNIALAGEACVSSKVREIGDIYPVHTFVPVQVDISVVNRIATENQPYHFGTLEQIERQGITPQEDEVILFGNNIESFKLKLSYIKRCTQPVDVYLAYSFNLASPGDWPATRNRQILLDPDFNCAEAYHCQIETDVSPTSLDETDVIELSWDMNEIRQKIPPYTKVYVQAGSFPAGPFRFEEGDISNLLTLIYYPETIPVCILQELHDPFFGDKTYWAHPTTKETASFEFPCYFPNKPE